MNRFPFTLYDPNYVSPARREEIEAEREREEEETQSEDTPELEGPALERKQG